MRPYGILELARTGRIALVRGDRADRDDAAEDADGRAAGRRRAFEPVTEPTAIRSQSTLAAGRRPSTSPPRLPIAAVFRSPRLCTPPTASPKETADAGHDVLRPGRRPVLCSRARRSPSSATAARGTPRPRTCATRGCNVVVGQRPGSANYDLAVKRRLQAGLGRRGRRGRATWSTSSLPDEVQGDIYATRHQARTSSPGNLLLCSHGFNIHFGQVVPPEGVDSALVAPKGPGHLVRSEFVKGGGVPCLIATGEGCSRRTARRSALAYAKGIGGTRGGVLQTTFAEETETDLFGEQVVLCGGVSALVKMGFETLSRPATSPRSPTSSACTS